MPGPLFARGELRGFLGALLESARARIEGLDEDELLSRSSDDIAAEVAADARIGALEIGEEAVDGSVTETTIHIQNLVGRYGPARAWRIRALYPFRGDHRLFDFSPSQNLWVVVEGEVRADGHLELEVVYPGPEPEAEQVRQQLAQQLNRLRQMAGFVSADTSTYDNHVEQRLRDAVEARRERILKRRNLAGSLGLPITRRSDAPKFVPLQRKQITIQRPPRQASRPYRDEPALSDAQFEEAIAVIRDALLAMERSPSVASEKKEEELRDQILVLLNGTFQGAATSETFVQRGKADILLKIDDRHVFVAECKWWDGPKACKDAVDQLLSYLPWRDEKAVLILFIDRRDASSAIESADGAIRDHQAFKRPGRSSVDPMARRNFVLGHPDDMDREIYLCALFAVLPRQGRVDPGAG